MKGRYAAVGENFRRVCEQIAQAARQAGRQPSEVRLVVVTKGHPVEAVFAAIEAGIHIFGENYPEEGVAKMQALSGEENLEWHMVGHVQSRKARLTAEYYHWVHSVDSLKLAERLNRSAAEIGRSLPILLECNVSGETSKFGWPAWNESGWESLVEPFRQILALEHLKVRGLMTIPPFFEEADRARPFFRRLRRLRDFLTEALPQASWEELSMGMSNDFVVAIQEGATMVRIGTAILGPRPQ